LHDDGLFFSNLIRKRNKKIPIYQLLQDFLSKTPQNLNSITISFVQISQIISLALPDSGILHMSPKVLYTFFEESL